MIHVCKEGPLILTKTVLDIFPSTWTIIDAKAELKDQVLSGKYEVKNINFLSDQYPSLIILPAIYTVNEHVTINQIYLSEYK